MDERELTIAKLKLLAKSLQKMESDMLDMMGVIMKIGSEVLDAIDKLESR